MYTVILAQEAHPNKHPFTIKLFPTDRPSDSAPFGTEGKKILIPHAVAEKYLPTLEGMAVNARGDWLSHDKDHKVGVITSTRIENGWAVAEGHFYAHDHPDTVKELRSLAAAGDLGASLEATQTFASETGDLLIVQSITFTGATVMLAKAAAWTSTRVAAQSSSPETPTPMPDTNPTPAADVQAGATTPAAPNVDLAAVLAQLAQGQAALVTAMTGLTDKVGSIQAAATPAPAPVPVDPKDAKIADLESKLTALVGKVEAAADAAKKSAAAPQRKTFSSTSVLAARYPDVAAAADSATGDPNAVIDQLRAAGKITDVDSIALKLGVIKSPAPSAE